MPEGRKQAGWKDLATPVQLRGMRTAISAQCFGSLAYVLHRNGVMLVYMKALGIGDAAIVTCLALFTLGDGLSRPPFAYFSDHVGKKRVGLLGILLQILGFVAIALAGFLPPAQATLAVAGGTLGAAVGMGMMGSSWYALLDPIVPRGLRGRFFGTLRLSWQAVGLALTALCAVLLGTRASVGHFQLAMLVVVAFLMIRLPIYHRIPDLEPRSTREGSLYQALKTVLRGPGCASFCAYVFLLATFTTGAPALFGLVEREFLNFGDNQVVWMGNLMAVGALAGFALGGKVVDRWGTKPAFILCHFGFGGVMLLFLARGAFGVPVLWVAGAANALFGLVAGASSIAISVELLALMPSANKSFATSLGQCFFMAGGALSGFISAGVLGLGFLKDTWTLFGATMSKFDAILLTYGCMVAGLVVTLGLIPSVIGKPEWTPRS